MGVDYVQEQRVLILHSSITCILFSAILLFLHFSDNLCNVGTYKFSSILTTIALAELVKLSLTNFHVDHLTVGKLDHSSRSKKTCTKTFKDSLKFMSAVIGVTAIYYVSIVLFGAPVTTHYQETFMLSITLTTLTFVPASLHLGIDHALAIFTGSSLSISGAFVDAVKLNVKTVLIGTWLSAFVLPLDWNRPWQAWPIPCVVGALLGYFASHFITFVKSSTTRLKKRNRKGEPLKSC